METALLQNIVKDLGKESRKGTFEVRKPKVSEGCQEVTVRESPEELTLRTEEVGTVKAYVNVDHERKMGSSQWISTGRPFLSGVV